MLLVEKVGVDLAVRWFTSNVTEQAEAARSWLGNVDNLNVDIWSQLTGQMKEDVIYRNFDSDPGEPFQTWQNFARALECRSTDNSRPGGLPINIESPFLPVVGYIPSGKISKLRSIVQRTGDSNSLQIIDNLIAQRERACQVDFSRQPLTRRILYSLTRDERELIATIMDNVRQGGFRPALLPEIFMSYEAPPLFVAYPELEEEGGVSDMKPRVSRNNQRRLPENISIEQVLGYYVPEPKIILFARGLDWFAKKYGCNEKLLRAVVLVHEVGHWVTHLLPKPGVPEWQIDLYKLTEEDVHEGWAQLITWWVAEEVGGDFKCTFEELNRSQSAPYRVYEKFKGKSVGSVMASLERLRELRWPARVEDWEGLCR